VKHWRALDGVRGVAVLLVVAYHLGLPHSSRGGTIGVLMFFVLSGFLITTLLLRECDSTGTVRFSWFYARRALRLLPALAVFVPAVVLYCVATGRSGPTIGSAPAVALYGANWVRAVRGFDTLGLFEHTWSLSVEEQFYLVWPAVVVLAGVLVPRRRRASAVLAACLVGIVVSFAWRLALWNAADPAGSAARLYNGTDTAADQLLIGCALGAGLVVAAAPVRERIGRWCAPLAPVAIAFLLWIAMFRPGGASAANNHLYLTWGQTAFALAAAVVVGACVLAPSSPVPRVLAIRPLVGIGRVSYGLYLWHYPVTVVVAERLSGASELARWSFVVAASAALTAASWFVVERPCLAFKRRFEPARSPRPAEIGVSPVMAG